LMESSEADFERWISNDEIFKESEDDEPERAKCV